MSTAEWTRQVAGEVQQQKGEKKYLGIPES